MKGIIRKTKIPTRYLVIGSNYDDEGRTRKKRSYREKGTLSLEYLK